MKIYQTTTFIFLALFICLLPIKSTFAGLNAKVTFSDTDNNFNSLGTLFYFFDLRERETFIQLTFPDTSSTGVNAAAHVQVFDVSNNCNENDFFDTYTPFDTHVYNMRDIQTNDGNDSGVVLPDGAYGIVAVDLEVPNLGSGRPIGNLRIIDNNGYEYRTNPQGIFGSSSDVSNIPSGYYTFNFNQEAGIAFSDVVGITVNNLGDEWNASNPINAYNTFDVDIIDNNEVPFSCRDVIFACVDEDNPRLEELLEFAGTANVARFEYGINNTIPHSKGGELLCPGNNIPEGVVVLRPELQPITPQGASFFGFIGLNNGNGRGSLDSFWYYNFYIPPQTG